MPAHRYRLDSCRVALDDGTVGNVPLFVLEEGAVGITLEDVLGAGERGNAIADAKEFLLEELGRGRQLATEVQERAKAEEISPRTLRRAKKTLGVISERDGYSAEGAWYWRLPSEDDSEGDQ